MSLELALILGNTLGLLLALGVIVANRGRGRARPGGRVADVVFRSPQGSVQRLSQWRGRRVALCLLSPWDAEHPARRAELLALEPIARDQAVVAIIVNGSVGDAKALSQTFPERLPVFVCSERAAAALHVAALPAMRLVNASGTLVGSFEGIAAESVLNQFNPTSGTVAHG